MNIIIAVLDRNFFNPGKDPASENTKQFAN